MAANVHDLLIFLKQHALGRELEEASEQEVEIEGLGAGQQSSRNSCNQKGWSSKVGSRTVH